MSTTVQTADGFNVTSSHESAKDMLAILDAPEEGQPKGRVIADKGKSIEEGEEPDEVSEAASTLGKKGAAAAAEKRADAARAKAADEKKAAKDAKKAEAAAPAEEETEEQEAAGDEPDADAAKLAAEKKAARHDAQARIAQLAREKKDADERAERAERDLAQERRQRTAQPPAEERRAAQPAPAAADEPAEPRMEDFLDIGSFTKALADHQWDKRQREADERQTHEAVQRHIDKLHVEFAERIAGVKPDAPDFTEKVNEFAESLSPEVRELQSTPDLLRKNPNAQPTEYNHIMDHVVASSMAPELLRYLSDNPKELQRIAALRTLAPIRLALARVEGRLDREDAATSATSSEREPSRAKPPVKALTGSPHAASAEPDPEKATFDEHLRFYGKGDRKR